MLEACSFANIIDEVKHVKEIEVEGITFKLTYYLGGDWKFLAVVTGIDSASSDHACMWCKCKKDEWYVIQLEWCLSDKDRGAWMTDENRELAKLVCHIDF